MILIVDDDNAVRLSIGLALKRAGMEFEAVGSEKEALDLVRDTRFKLAVLDMNLRLETTGQQGLEMLQKFRILRPDMPVILLTAWGTIPLAVSAMNHGAEDFLTKPWSNEDLVKKIRTALNRADAERQTAEHVDTLDTLERRAIVDALHRADGNLSTAARLLGITRQALYRRMKKFDIDEV